MLKKDLDPSRYFSAKGPELDLSNRTLLHGDFIDVNDFKKSIIPFLKTHPEIKVLNFSDMLIQRCTGSYCMQDDEIAALVTVLPPNLTELYLGGTQIQDKTAVALAAALPQTITVFNLDLTDIGPNAIADKQNLTVLNLGSNKIGSVGAKIIAPAFVNKPKLDVLHLGGNQIGVDGAQSLASVLGAQSLASVLGKPHLASLDCSDNNLNDEGVTILCRSLVGQSNLQHLNLAKNDISDAGAEEISNVLASQLNFTGLVLSENRIGDAGIKKICNSLKNKQDFSVLDVSYNKIGDAGAKAIGKAIGGKQNFSNLHLRCNAIGDQGAEAICKALVNKEKIKKFNVSKNPISDRVIEMLASVLVTHSSFLWNKNTGIDRLQYWKDIPDIDLCITVHARYTELKNRCNSMFEEANPVKRANFAREKQQQQVDKKEIPNFTEQLSGVSITQNGSSAAEVTKKPVFPTLVPSLQHMTIFATQNILKKQQHASLLLTEKNLQTQLLPTQQELDLPWSPQKRRVRETKLREVLPEDLVETFCLNM